MSTLTVEEELSILADLLCKPLQLTEKSDNHSVPLYLYELTKIIRLYVPTLYYCDNKLIIGTSTDHIMRIHISNKNELFVTDFKNIYKMIQIKKSKATNTKKKQKKNKQSQDNNIYKPKISKTNSKKLLHRTISKKKLRPFFKCTVVAATKIDENFQIDPHNNIFYTLGVGFFKEAIFILRVKPDSDDKKESEYLKPRRIHTFSSGEGNRILSVNSSKCYKEKKNKYVILHCRALNKFFRMKYCVKTHDLKIEEWRISSDFPRIQWLISYPFNSKLCFAMIVNWDINMVILYGVLLYKDNKSCIPFEIFRFKLTDFDGKDKGRQHHCYTMCWLKNINKLCVVVEGECFLIYFNDAIINNKDINDAGNKLIRMKSSWIKYNIGMLVERNSIDGTNYFYPKSITQYTHTNFVIGVNGTNTASMFQIL